MPSPARRHDRARLTTASPARDRLYHADSATASVLVHDIADGEVDSASRRVFARLEGNFAQEL